MNRNNPQATVPNSYQNIAIPTDGSEGAHHAAGHGLAIADAFDATVHAVSVIEDSGAEQRDQLRTSPEELAREAVESIEDRAIQHGVDVQTETLSGMPKETLLIYFEENAIDMAVMSTHGRTGIEQIVFGSITEEIVRNSPIPVLTVRPPEWND